MSDIFEQIFGQSTGDIVKDITITEVILINGCYSISYTRKAYGFGSITLSMQDGKLYLDTEASSLEHVAAVWQKALLFIVKNGTTDHNR